MTNPANHISVVAVGELMAESRGSVDPSRFPDETFDLYSIPAFDRGEPDIVVGSAIGSAKQTIEPGDVLLSKIVPHIRRSGVVNDQRGRRMIASGEWIVFRSRRFYAPYLRHVLLGDQFHIAFMQTVAGVGGSLLRARPSQVAKIKIPLPPLPEQERIAEVLDKTETLRAKRRKAIEKLDVLQNSIFTEMFGDSRINPKAFPVVTLGELVVSGPQNGLYKPGSDYGAGTRILRIDSFYDGWIYNVEGLKRVRTSASENALYGLRESDILINRVNSRSYLGKSAIVPPLREPVVFESNMMRLSVDENRMVPMFTIRLLQTQHIKAQILSRAKDSVNQSSINQQDVKSLNMITPPISLQNQFASAVAKLQAALGQFQSSAKTIDDLFVSLQDQLFSRDQDAANNENSPKLGESNDLQLSLSNP